jgi:hypothetical protein
MARELREGYPSIRSEVQCRVASLVPTIVAYPPGKTYVEHPERGICWDVSNAHAAPRTDVSSEHD